ncbi:MAG TPA: LysM peptidoglycan-binding domain-containing protein [Longimicrobiales bacterium]
MLRNLVRTPARILLPVVLMMAASSAQAQEPAAEPQQQREHLVRRGDTLWDLARAYLENPFLWRLIYEANRDVVEDPHWIYPAERLVIPPLLAQDAPGSVTRPPLGTPIKPPLGTPIGMELREIPMAPPVAVSDTPAATVVETVDLRHPVVALSEYLATPWVSETARREVNGSILRLADPAAMQDRLASNLHPNDRVHLGDLGRNRPEVGDSLLVVRFARRLLGRGDVVEPLAVLLVEDVTATVATARVVRQFGAARLGDSVMPLAPLPAIGLGEPVAIENGPDGELIEFVTEDDPLYGTTDLAFISLGQASGVGIGDEFMVYVPARGVRLQAETLPPEVVATVRVVKVADNTSTVRVLSVNSGALRDGLPIRMIRKMP